MKNVFVLCAVALLLASLYSCKKCYNCTREKFCYSCVQNTDTLEKCAEKGQSKETFDAYIQSLTDYTCTAKLKTDKDQTELCDRGLVSTTTGISIDKTTLELNGWSCVKK